MKNIILSIFLFVFTVNIQADCIKIDSKNIIIEWEAFKTLSKVGVKGKMPSFSLNGKVKGSSINQIIKATSISIDSSIVDTGKAVRDKTISTSFFKRMSSKYISANVVSINPKGKQIIIRIKANNITKNIPFSYSINGNKLFAKATIDVFDFQLHDSLKSLSRACKALHKGKTWSDVNLFLMANFTTCN